MTINEFRALQRKLGDCGEITVHTGSGRPRVIRWHGENPHDLWVCFPSGRVADRIYLGGDPARMRRGRGKGGRRGGRPVASMMPADADAADRLAVYYMP